MLRCWGERVSFSKVPASGGGDQFVITAKGQKMALLSLEYPRSEGYLATPA